MSKRREISRRDFASRSILAVAGVAAGKTGVGGPKPETGPAPGGRGRGGHHPGVRASIRIRGEGGAPKRGFPPPPHREGKTPCDVDENLFASRAQDPALKNVETFRPGYQRDLRRVFDDKDVDAVIIATPNHWHALATIWGLQAGKHVYVEKPASHTVWEGRKMVEAAHRYGKLVQVGTMNRSRPPVREAIKYIQDGGIGEVYMARGLCFKPRPAIGKYPDGPMAPDEKYKLNVEATTYEPTYDNSYLANVSYDIWLGPAPARPFNRNRFHYNWHWHWDYGNGDTGNQGPHQFDIARWGLGKNEHPVRIRSGGGYFGEESSQETPNLHSTIFEYADGKILEFGTRGGYTNDEGTQRIGNLFYGTKGWVWIDGDGRKWQSYLGRKDEKGPGADVPKEKSGSGSDPLVLTSTEYPHYQNFIDAIRADDPKMLNCDVREGHLSSALPHLANISYRGGRALSFDGKTETIVGDADANKLLTREYRKPYVISDKV